jgi:asparagine synthase (glutamine-hydrolysing)
MSAIFGLLYLDGRSVHPAKLQQMAATLQHRGSAGHVWSLENVGMGCCLLSPQAAATQGRSSGGDADLSIVVDARLDNRGELLSLLGLAKTNVDIDDASLIAHTYARWGESCAERLLGDFTFALWDKRRRQLICGRDHVGVKPFYYCHWPGRIFAWATEIKALLCLSASLRQVDEERLAERLALIDWDLTDQSTLYRQVVSLPPAHMLKVSADALILSRYWSLDPERSLERGSASDHAEAFSHLFTAAVRCRLHGPGSVGALLSGGLDSSAIAWTAQSLPHGQARGPLPTFSAVFDTVTVCDERPYIHTVLASGRFAPHWTPGDQTSPLAELERMLWHQDELVYAPGISLMSTLHRAAQCQGINVLLDGHGGDEVTGCGAVYHRELARKGRWLTLVREIQASAHLHQEPFWALFWPYVRYGIRWPRRATRRFRRIGRHLRPGAQANQPSAHSPDNPPIWERWLHPDFVQRVGLRERYHAFQLRRPERAGDERESHYRLLTGRSQVRALEILNKASAAQAVELRFPFWDKRLVEFCLALPSAHKLYRGWDRITLRRAMHNRLPPQVQWRHDKTNFAPNLVYLLRTQDRELLEQLLVGQQNEASGYLNREAVEAAYRQFVSQEQPAPSVLQIVLQASILTIWLQGGQHLLRSDS